MKTNSISAGLVVHARTITPTRHLIFRRDWLWTAFLAFAAIAFGPQPAQAAVTEAWVQRYGPVAGSEDSAYKVVTDAAGNVIVAGSTGNQAGGGLDMLIIKYSGAGMSLWTNRYNGPDNSSDQASALAVDASGNVFVTGASTGSGGDSDYTTIAYSGAGVPLWTNRYHGLGNGHDEASAVAVDGSGNVFVTGASTGSGGDSDYTTIAYSGAGVPLWTNRYHGTSANSVDSATAVAVGGSGNVFVTGYSGYSFGDNSDYATIAYSGAGVPLWTNRYNGPENGYYDFASAVAVDGSGNVFVTGSSAVGLGNVDYATIAYSGAGVPLWTNRYNGPANITDQATAVAVDGSGTLFVTGSSVGSESYYDYATIAYSGAGVPLWTNRYHGPAAISDQATAVAVDGSGNVFVTGWSRYCDYGCDGNYYATIAYSGAGVPLCTNYYNGLIQTKSSLAIGSDGAVYVTFASDGDFVTVKYVHSTHAQLIINGGFETPDTPTYTQINAGQNTIAPWVVGLHSVEVGDAVGNGFITGPAFEGAQFLDLNGLQRGRLTQAFATTPGSLYTVTFAYTDNYWEPSTTASASAAVRLFDGLGDRLNQTITHTGAVAGNYHWTVFNEQFTALQSTTSLEFTSLTTSPSGHSGGIILDAVQVFEGASVKIVSITRIGTGPVMLKVLGVPNVAHRIQSSVDLSAGGFIDIGTVTPGATRLFQFEDTRAGLTNGFYRVVLP